MTLSTCRNSDRPHFLQCGEMCTLHPRRDVVFGRVSRRPVSPSVHVGTDSQVQGPSLVWTSACKGV